MPKFYCIHCGQRINAPDERAGTRASCPACKGEIQVPGLPPALDLPQLSPATEAPPAPPAPPATPPAPPATPPPIAPAAIITPAVTPPDTNSGPPTSFWSARTLAATLAAAFLCLLAVATRPSTQLELMGFTPRDILTGTGETLGRLIALSLASVVIALLAAWIMSAFKKRFADTLSRIYAIVVIVLSALSFVTSIGMKAIAPATGGNEKSRQDIEQDIRTLVKESAPPAGIPLQTKTREETRFDSGFQKEFNAATAKKSAEEEARIKAKEDDEAIANESFRKAVRSMIEENEARDRAGQETEKERARQTLADIQGDIQSLVKETTGPDGLPRKTDFRFEEEAPSGDDIQRLRQMMQSFYNDIITSQNEYATALDNDGLNTLLDADRMYEDRGFKDSRLALEKMKKTLATARTRTDQLLIDFPKRVEKYNFTSEVDREMLKGYQDGLEQSLPLIREIWDLEVKIVAHTEELVDYLKEKRLYWTPKEGKFFFEKDSDLELFNRLTKKITDCAARQSEIRQKSLRSSTDKIGSLKERLAD